MKGIRFKLWGGMMALVVVMILLLWFFQIVFLKSFYTEMRLADVGEQGVALANLLVGEESIPAEFRDRAEGLAFTNNLSIELLDLKGNERYAISSGNMAGGGQMMMRNAVRTEVFQQAAGGREVSLPMTHPRFGNRFMLLGLSVKSGDQIVGVLLITMPLAPVEETAAILQKQLLYITVILLLAALIITYLLARSFARPIQEIKRASEKIAAGDFSVSVDYKGQDEIGELSEAINRMGAALTKTEQLRKDLIANVSHELRTPLSLIRGYGETIRDVSGQNPVSRDKHVGVIIEESERLSRIVDDILSLSQWQGGYLKLNLAAYPLNDSLETVSRRYELLSAERGIPLSLEAGADCRVYGDQLRIEQVLYNLLNNAFNYTPAGGSIRVCLRQTGGKARIEVVDTGRGIPEEDIPKVWDRYYKGDTRSGRTRVGTGLGLAIVKSILEAHQAPYGVWSQKDGGTTFWFELPLD